MKRFEAGGETDPSDLLEQLSGRERERLSALIDGYLENAAPPQAWDAEAFEGSLAERATARVAESWSSAAGELPHRLVELRNQRKLKRRELVARLADALGVASQEQKVAAYYHRLERGTLQSDRVSAKVFDALASILGTTTDFLRKSGRRRRALGRRRAGSGVHAPDATRPGRSERAAPTTWRHDN